MNLAQLQEKLTKAARLQRPDERVPYAFEKRITALIGARTGVDRWAVWARGLWPAAAACVAVAVLCGAVSMLAPSKADTGLDLSQDFENTLLASIDQGEASMP